MEIRYFFRHPKVGHSIHRVFRTLISEIDKKHTTICFDVPSLGSKPYDIIKNNIFAYRKKDQRAIHHITGHIHDILIALFRVKTVLTVHDLVFLDNVKNPFKRMYKWLFWLYLPIKIADVVVCISNQTKERILKRIDTDKIKVIHNAIDPIYTTHLKDFNKKKPSILHIGTGWNKNLERSIEALKDIPCELRIIGRITNKQKELLNYHQVDFTNALNLSDAEIFEEYKNCDIVNFPSIYEGFGMPVIEGQKTGRIVITSSIEPLLEVSGEGAVFVSPNDIESLTSAYLKIISDDKYRGNIIKKGLKNVERFSVENIANQYDHIYKQLSTS